MIINCSCRLAQAKHPKSKCKPARHPQSVPSTPVEEKSDTPIILSNESTESRLLAANPMTATDFKPPLDELIPQIPELSCPDPLNDDTAFLQTAFKPYPVKRTFQHDLYEGLHFSFEDLSGCDEESTSQIHWQSLLSPSEFPDLLNNTQVDIDAL